MTEAIASVIRFISDAAHNFSENIDFSQYTFLQITLDILLVATLFYWMIMLMRGTRATNIMVGLVVVGLVFALSRIMNLIALGWLLDRLLTVILVAIPIIFQQEIRRGLEKLGKTKFFLAQEAKEIDIVRSDLITACFDMAQQRMGALIVIRGEVSLKEYIDTGVSLSARISPEVLVALFAKQSPLHDGAVIIDQNLIIAAGCVLPHSFKEYGHTFGTRHKAALGLSESTDAHIFVVSEEKGSVAYVSNGLLEGSLTQERMQKLLTNILAPKKLLKVNRKLPK